MHKIVNILLALMVVFACRNTEKQPSVVAGETTSLQLNYANGFTLQDHGRYSSITITRPWPGAEKRFTYALVPEGEAHPEGTFDAIVTTPIHTIVVTSTTHIPSLEMLGVEERLVGFPNLRYISSEKTRERIDAGKVKELGKNEALNTELIIDLSPEAVVTFAVEGDNKTVQTLERTGIPVLYNADWTETHPLGKAEWIKFFGVLFGKEQQADSIFKTIEANYLEAKKLAETAAKKPTVLSGAMYKDVWYLPQGDSWAAQFIADAQGAYLWADTEGTGSASLNIESVLEKGRTADVWIGPAQFTSFQQLREAHSVYEQFEAFQNKKVFSFTNRKGATGGVLYYELAPNRPDWVLQDIIKILHPELLPNHTFQFFTPLEP
ncbi:ABC transporter substrate-binding protein [Altibacter sp. HG106]|uniref:ABC transporter substrate-binding protein n=1 Tax=Altibacter sp. HG106 TaxID=3023937 RepID=UPI002350B3D6|nr:ABC transporter substrate-binding protein [Altibacter sp. HG106]MDC7993753.1 ABC transporter substrate-binding protein [Altibacter sp. HG106]